MRVKSATSYPVQQLHDIAVTDDIRRPRNGQRCLVRPFHYPPVIDILEAVAGDLLLVGGTATVCVADRINVRVGVKPTSATVCVSVWGVLAFINKLDL